MLLDPQRKKIATLIVGKLKTAPKSGPKEDFVQALGESSDTGEFETPEDESMVGLSSAMEDLAKALEAKDFTQAARVFSDAMYLCQDSKEPEGEGKAEESPGYMG